MNGAAPLAAAREVRRPFRVPSALSLRAASLAAMGVLLAGFAWQAPGFLLPGNLANILQQAAILGLLSFGMTAVMIAGGGDVVRGGIDLSIAANMGFCAAVYAVLVHAGRGDAVAVAATLLAGTGIGALNAIAVRRFGIVPLLATLAVMNLAGGLELILTRNTVISASTPLLESLGGNGPFGIPWLAIVFVAAAVLLAALLDHAPFGLRLRAVGAHPEAARAAGLQVGAYVSASYLLSGACASIAAVLSAALLSGSSPGSGDSLLPAVLTALLGVVVSRRLTPSIGGTVLGVLFIGALVNAFQLLNLSSYWVSGVEGTLILVAVTLTTLARRQVVS